VAVPAAFLSPGAWSDVPLELEGFGMKSLLFTVSLCLGALSAVVAPGGGSAADKPGDPIPWPDGLPVYDHVVIVVEENKDYDQIIDSPDAPFINELRKEGANFTQMFGEEHHSQGNYFWLFSGSNHGVGFRDGVPHKKLQDQPNLGSALIKRNLSFKGYAESLPDVGSEVVYAPKGAEGHDRLYARKHVPWISFDNVPSQGPAAKSSNLPFSDFPTNFDALPTVAFVIPNLKNDMHDQDKKLTKEEGFKQSIKHGDDWLKTNLGAYYRWAKTHNSLLIVTFDENADETDMVGLTNPFVKPDTRANKDLQNRICTIFAGAHIKPGDYKEDKGITHVNILRTLEAMYKLPRSGAQQPSAAHGGITDNYIVTDVFKTK
jgi:acid phosphatase